MGSPGLDPRFVLLSQSTRGVVLGGLKQWPGSRAGQRLGTKRWKAAFPAVGREPGRDRGRNC